MTRGLLLMLGGMLVVFGALFVALEIRNDWKVTKALAVVTRAELYHAACAPRPEATP